MRFLKMNLTRLPSPERFNVQEWNEITYRSDVRTGLAQAL
jgi:hypothetical protein